MGNDCLLLPPKLECINSEELGRTDLDIMCEKRRECINEVTTSFKVRDKVVRNSHLSSAGGTTPAEMDEM